MNAPKDKKEYYSRWSKGEFGNRLRVWNTVEEYLDDDFDGLVGIRHLIPGSPYCKVPLTKEEVRALNWRKDFVINEYLPNEYVLFQGEIFRDYTGLRLFGAFGQQLMRQALKVSREYMNLSAKMLLQAHCNSKSYEMLNELMEKYEEAVIEFTICNRNVGILPSHNVVVWEVRGGY